MTKTDARSRFLGYINYAAGFTAKFTNTTVQIVPVPPGVVSRGGGKNHFEIPQPPVVASRAKIFQGRTDCYIIY